MTDTIARRASEDAPKGRRRWRMPWVNAGIGFVAFVGVLVLIYPGVASWVSQYYQSLVIQDLDVIVDEGPPARLLHELEKAYAYNEALVGGRTVVSPNSNIPIGPDTSPDGFSYADMLRADDLGLMARLRIPSIKVDLPVYHGTSDDVLAKGVGHLEGTSLPVGGESQHAVLTAHRGLPSATLFDDLDQVKIGDTFTIEVFGDILTYKVVETQTVLPDQTQSLVPRYGEDLVTLVTCTPLGINTHRYLVTGERVTPTPIHDLQKAGVKPDIPGFPWWIPQLALAVLGYVALIGISGLPRFQRQRRPRH